MTAVLSSTLSVDFDMYAVHLAGGSVRLEGEVWPQAGLGDWFEQSLPGDEGLLQRCVGPTLDVGCGPGRLAAALARRGLPSLGIDVSPVAVAFARSQGAIALRRDVHGEVPGAGRWSTLLLADGNIGIGADPVALLRRCRDLLAPGGRVLVDLAPGNQVQTGWVRCVCDEVAGPWFSWSQVGVGAIADLAEHAGMFVAAQWDSAGRWQAALAGEH